MTGGKAAVGLFAMLLAVVAPDVRAQQAIVVFDEDASAAGGLVEPPDSLLLTGDERLPLVTGSAQSGSVSGLVQVRHSTGRWEVLLSRDEGDITGFDTLVVYINGPESIRGDEMPRIGLEDASGARSHANSLSRLENVEVDETRTGFTSESTTDVLLDVRYSAALPSNRRRPGYPEDLYVTFSDVPVDTSTRGIGAPPTPVKFSVRTASGIQLDFTFRDTDGDSTLSRENEYIDVLLPEDYDSARLLPAWRITMAPSLPLLPIGDGDVFHLALAYEETTLDSDPESWQRRAFPIADLAAEIDPSTWVSVFLTYAAPNPVTRTLWIDHVTLEKNDDDTLLELIQKQTFEFFWQEANPSNGLIKDRSTSDSPASIASVGFGLSAITVGVDHGWITYDAGRERVARTLRFFRDAPQSQASDATGYKGFFYHFLDMNSGRRAWNSELSTIDTALLLGGVLHVREYFRDDDEIRTLADSIYHRVDWAWMQYRRTKNPSAAISHGWRPESGFIQSDWIGYNEAMLLYVLALGSPTHPAGDGAWEAWTSGYDWQTQYGFTYVTFPPLFGHQYSHVWIDFRGIQDAYMRSKGIDYFENSRRATLAQRAYHIFNPKGWPNYSKDEWGLTASDTPVGYLARGAPPPQNDDGTLVPTAPGGSIPFTPDESIAALRTMYEKYPLLWGPYGFRDAYNVSRNWWDNDYIGIDQGPILLMIENYRTESVWDAFMANEAIRRGLERAGFTGVGLATDDQSPETAQELSIFPNPSAGRARVTFALESPGRVRLEIYDLLGRRVSVVSDDRRSSGLHNMTLDLPLVPSGIYFVVLETPVGRMTHPFAIVR